MPSPVTVGITASIAQIILDGQVRDFFGLAMNQIPAEFIKKSGQRTSIATLIQR